MNKDYCPICGEITLVHESKSVTYTHKGHAFTIDQPADWCSACGEGIINPENNQAVKAIILKEKSRIDGSLAAKTDSENKKNY